MNRLTVTSAELRTTAIGMRNAAGGIGAEFDRLMGRVRELTSSWTGQGASAFNGYYEQFNTSWSQCREALNGVAGMLEVAAQSYDETEAGIASRFRQ